jgi:hypothetical protein
MAEQPRHGRLDADWVERLRMELETRQARSLKRWATATAFIVAVLVFVTLQRMREAVTDPRPLAVADIVIGNIEGGASATQEERLREAVLNELARRRRPGPAGKRTVRIHLEVVIGAKQPGMCKQWSGGKAPCDVRPVELLWRAREGDTKLGTVSQKNDIPADYYEPWDVIYSQADLIAEGAVKGILRLLEDR